MDSFSLGKMVGIMKSIKVSELFYSIQGEGRYQGVPSVFLRTFGCNFNCAGFGMPKGELSQERLNVDPEQYSKYEDLPLVKTGCDSYASWDTRFKHLSPVMSIDEIVDKIMSLLPHGEWRDEHLVITGGEPLLGWQRAYPELLNHPKMLGLKELTFETNGTQHIATEFFRFLLKWKWAIPQREITFSVSTKLSCSGHTREEAVNTAAVIEYETVGTAYLKFVVATEDDVNEALETMNIYRNAGFKGSVYLMPVGGVEEVYKLNNRNVAELALKHGLRYSDRLHVPLWKNAWGT